MKRILKFELDQTDVETILAALRERRYQLRNCADRHRRVFGLKPYEDEEEVQLLNEIYLTEESIRYQRRRQQAWGVD